MYAIDGASGDRAKSRLNYGRYPSASKSRDYNLLRQAKAVGAKMTSVSRESWIKHLISEKEAELKKLRKILVDIEAGLDPQTRPLQLPEAKEDGEKQLKE